MLYAIVAVIALIVDQAVKYWTTAHIVLNTGTKELIPGFIHLANVHNTGAAFSFLEGARWFFVVLCLVFVAALVYLLYHDIIKGRVARWMSVLVLAGAVGNCIDRIISGYVVDMFEFQFHIFGGQFPVFNVADILITVCGIAFCVCILLEKPENEGKSGKNVAPVPAPAADEVVEKPVVEKPVVEKPVKAAKFAPKKRHKIEIPDFPKHEHTEAAPIDPNDPFAEWERIAAGKSAAPKAEERTQPAQPKAAPAAKPVQPAAPASERVVKTERESAVKTERESTVKTEEPKVAPAPQAAPATPTPAPKVDSADSYDLEDILAEFRDL
jgi:signal peptidase II